MTHIIMDHGVSGCFGTKLAPNRILAKRPCQGRTPTADASNVSDDGYVLKMRTGILHIAGAYIIRFVLYRPLSFNSRSFTSAGAITSLSRFARSSSKLLYRYGGSTQWYFFSVPNMLNGS
jgi:hypothetical protein